MSRNKELVSTLKDAGGLRLPGFDMVHVADVHSTGEVHRISLAARIYETFSVPDHTEVFVIDYDAFRSVLLVDGPDSRRPFWLAQQLRDKVVSWNVHRIVERTQLQHLRPHQRVFRTRVGVRVDSVSFMSSGESFEVRVRLANHTRIIGEPTQAVERLL